MTKSVKELGAFIELLFGLCEFALGFDGIGDTAVLFLHDFRVVDFLFFLDLRAERRYLISETLVLELDVFHGHFLVINHSDFFPLVFLYLIEGISVFFLVIEIQIVGLVAGGLVVGGFLDLLKLIKRILLAVKKMDYRLGFDRFLVRF